MRVQKGKSYKYEANGYDLFDAKVTIPNGTVVRVVHCHGCPTPNTMGHAHIETEDGKFLGLVDTRSLKRV